MADREETATWTRARSADDDVELFTWAPFGDAGVDVVVTTREGGVSDGSFKSLNLGLHVGDDERAVIENRRRALGALGAGLGDLVLGAQVHGSCAALVGPADAGRGSRSSAEAVAGADALVTTEPELVLGTLVADCAPIVLVDPDARVLATVHAGWRGAAAGIVGVAIETMRSRGATTSRVLAGIGPSVSPHTYEVGADVAEAISRALADSPGDASDAERADGAGDLGRVLVPLRKGKWLLDVAGVSRVQLERAGVPADQIFVSPWATDDGRFYSYRADPRCGRFGLFARLR